MNRRPVVLFRPATTTRDPKPGVVTKTTSSPMAGIVASRARSLQTNGLPQSSRKIASTRSAPLGLRTTPRTRANIPKTKKVAFESAPIQASRATRVKISVALLTATLSNTVAKITPTTAMKDHRTHDGPCVLRTRASTTRPRTLNGPAHREGRVGATLFDPGPLGDLPAPLLGEIAGALRP
jgi:hypothetical protein